MKKFIAVFLSLLCIFSVFGITASAGTFDELSEIIGEDKGLYCITYQNETASGVSMMYKPNPSISVDGPGYVTVTKDTPIAVDHEFVCWQDEDGNLYYEGDKIYVDGEVTLYAVWTEKTDNLPRVIRVIQTAILTLQRMVQKVLGVFKDIQDFESEYFTTTDVEATVA
ncbi:MAG: hypothetical protein ACI4XE_04420 [Acutalibacteraceae bacterium]